MMIFSVIGGLCLIFGFVGIFVAMFKTSVAWGICGLLLAPAILVFLFKHWHSAKKPFFLQLIGAGLLSVGAAVAR